MKIRLLKDISVPNSDILLKKGTELHATRLNSNDDRAVIVVSDECDSYSNTSVTLSPGMFEELSGLTSSLPRSAPETLHPSARFNCETKSAGTVRVPPLDSEYEDLIIVTDVYGERVLRQQILVYPSDSDDEYVSVRFNPDGSIAEVMVPHGTCLTYADDPEVSAWMLERDGQ